MSGADSSTEQCPPSSLLPLLETLEDPAAAPGALTDALLTLTNRLSGEDGKEFAAEVGKCFSQLYKIFKTHIPTENSELSSAALQALGFCVFNSNIAYLLTETEIQELFSILNSVATKAADKNTRTRALWVIAKQSFPPDIVGKAVPSIITMLETVLNRGDVHSMVVEYEALNVIIRLIEQAPSEMEEQAGSWAKLIIPLVVHSAHKVQLRSATALEMGVPLLLQKQQEVAAITEELMTTKIIPDLQRLFSSKNETYVLKLWPLFVKLLGKALHRSGSFINSLLQLEELGFRSGSPVVKKIAFIAWKSLIDNFALNPEILCSTKRLKLLMQPLSSIHVRTEALALTKMEVWWYLLMRLGPQLPAHFEQVCVPLIQSTLSLDASLQQGNSSRVSINQSLTPCSSQKSGAFPFGTSSTQRKSLNSSMGGIGSIPSIQLLGIEMLLHFFMGPEVLAFAKENKLVFSLEPLQHSVITSPSFFCKHASTFIHAVQDGFIAVGKDASDIILKAVWKEMIAFVRAAIELGSKKERQSSEVFTMLLKALKNIVVSNELPVLTSLSLIEITIKELPPKVLGSPAYQVADMDLLNGTPALFIIQLSFQEDLLKCCVQDERFFLNYESLVRFVLSGPTSPLAFSESVVTMANQSAKYLENKEHLWRIWSIVVNPLTEWINQTNEVNQGDALEHNFSAIYSALLLPVDHIFPAPAFPQPVMKTLLRSWSELYRSFARCASLVATAEDNLCCEELCAKIVYGLEDETRINQPMLDGLAHIVSVMIDCINFVPYGTKYQPVNKSPQTPTDWSKKKREPLGKLSSLTKLLAILINSLCTLKTKESHSEKLAAAAACVISGVQNILGHISLPSVIRSLFGTIMNPIVAYYEKTVSADASRVNNGLNNKFEKLLVESMNCLQAHYTGSFDSELLQELSPFLSIILLNKNKHIRSQAAQFWNATFGKAVTLTYPEELKSLLCQAKKKVLLSLPGFESIGIVGESNGIVGESDSMENSQWDTKISGIEVKPSGKRGSLLVQANEVKEKNTNSHGTPAKMKLEFPLSKTNRKDMLLEEENTVDFVFIPPETKELVLTEHQKEVLRTKKVDIPTMYNNLDASQDTTLFSQYTQSQEDFSEKQTCDIKEDVKKEESEIRCQDEKVTNDKPGTAHEITENGNLDVHLEKAELTNMEQLGVKEEQNSRSSLETSACKPALEESSVLDKSSNESTPSGDGDSSSASSDVISGTPQPVSRRQSFTTLEKFDSAEHRSFSSSTFNNALGASGSTSLLAAQESMIASDASSKGEPVVENKDSLKPKVEETITRTKRLCLESPDAPETYSKIKKAKEDIKASSKLQPENTPGIKKSSLRYSKTELSEDKKSKHTQVEQDKNRQVSPTKHSEDKNTLLGEVKAAECKLGVQTQALDTTAENKQILDNIAEAKVGLNLDSKENTPPEVAASGDTISTVGQTPPMSPNQKPLRRSLRRRSETTEGTTDSPDKENNQQKKDRRKDEEKLLPKKIPQSKEDAGHNQKSVSEKTTDVQGTVNRQENGVHGSSAAEGVGSKDYCASRNLQEETSASNRKSEGHSASDMDDLPDSGPDITGGKPKGLPRYHTRRTTQGLLASIENSESDSSETREEGTRRKRSRRRNNKCNSLDSQAKEEEESQNQEPNSQEMVTEIQATIAETAESMHPEVCPEVPLVASDENDSMLKDCSGLGGSVGTLLDSSGAEESAAETLAKGTSEPALRTRQATKMLDKDSVSADSTSCVSEISGDGDYTTAASTFSSSEKPSESSECLHKRSKRARRSRSCNCCGEKPFVQLEKASPETPKADSPELKLKEPRRLSSKAALTLADIPAAQESNSEENLDVEPCATSTPVSHAQDCVDLKDSSSGTESEKELLGEDIPEDEREKPCVTSELCQPISEMLDCADWATETSEPPITNSAEPIAQCMPLEVKTEPAALKKEGIHQNGPLEASTDAEMAIDQPEETTISDPVADIIQNDAPKTEVASVAEILESQDSEMDEKASSETPATLMASETSALEQDDEAKENNNVDSPLKLKELDAASLPKVDESPNGIQPRCIWSPSASPSNSILKRGIKRQQEEESPSPANKSRRVSFANPIYQEELADDIDRRSPVVRAHSSSSSPPSRSSRPLSNHQAKHITTPTKGSLSLGSRSHKYKSSKKCLITEMVKEPLPAPTESIYPALVGCKVAVDTILPQITWARGFGQLIRAKNIRTVGDLSSLTATEIKTLPIRSPKVSNVRRALKAYHEQQVKSRGSEEMAGLDDIEKPVNGIDERAFSLHEDKVATDLTESAASGTDEQLTTDLLTQINMLAAQFSSEDLHNYSGSDLFEMQEKLYSITNSIMKNLQSRWPASSRESTV